MTDQQHNTAADRANQLLVEGLLGAGRQKEAIDLCIRICSGPGAKPQDWLMFGCLSADTGNVATAKAALEKAVELDPELVEAHFALGKLLAAAGNPQSAVAQLEKAAQLRPDSAELWLTLGITYGLTKRADKAEECCRRSLELQPDSIQARFNLANALQARGKLDEAEAEYEAVLQIEPGLAAGWSMLAQARVGLRKYDEAEVAANRALTLEPGMGEAHFTLGNILYILDDKEKARDHFRRAAELLPRLPDAHMRLGHVLYDLGDYAAAAESLQKVLNFNPRLPDVHHLMGECFRRRKMSGRAENCYRKALALNKDHLQAHYCLAFILGLMNRSAESAKHFAEVVRLKPNDEQARHLLAAQRGETTSTAPASYVTTLFDGFADTFDSKLVGELGYHIPELMYDMVSRFAATTPNSLDMIDLGCGTGLCASFFRPMARALHGVDLSTRMIEKARERALYDTLEVGDVASSLKSKTAAWDLAISADVFVYVGDLRDIFGACASALRPGGMFAFSVEAADDTDTFVLRGTGRYAHAGAYIRALAAASGFSEIDHHDVVVRKEKGQDVNGHLFLLRRASDAP